VVLLIINLFAGYKMGLVNQAIELTGAILGIFLAFQWAGAIPQWLEESSGLVTKIKEGLAGTKLAALFGGNFAEILLQVVSFCAVFVAVNLVVNFLGAALQHLCKFSLLKSVDRLSGAGLGLIKGGILVCIILFLLTLLPLPGLQNQVGKSHLAAKFIAVTPAIYNQVEKIIPADFPKIMITSQGVQFRSIDFSQLDGSICVACGEKVQFLGYFPKGQYRSPKFICTVCGRTSDGCQTYEGYHEIYGECPVVKCRNGIQIDCKVWPNGNFVTPQGPCTVCGETGLLQMQTAN